MFWKRKQDIESSIATADKPAPAKVKNLSFKETMEHQIRQLRATECLSYRLAESYAGGNRLAIVEVDPKSAENKKQYTISVDIVVHEKPVGAKVCVMKCDDPDNIVGWINKHRNKNYN